jgi:hypothetical protein
MYTASQRFPFFPLAFFFAFGFSVGHFPSGIAISLVPA